MATLMVVTVVGETEETLRVAWEGGGDTEKQSVEPTEHNDFSRSWGWRKNQKSFWSQVSTCSLKSIQLQATEKKTRNNLNTEYLCIFFT